MRNSVIIFCCALLIFWLLLCPAGQCASEYPEKRMVHGFYSWYCTELLSNNKTPPEYNDKIYTYVAKCTVDKLRTNHQRNIVSDNYFIKSNDFWAELLENMIVYDPYRIDDTTSIVLVSFPVTRGKTHTIIVFIKKENKQFRITKVEDTY